MIERIDKKKELVSTLIIIFATDTFLVFANANEMIKHVFQLLLIMLSVFLLYKSKGKFKRSGFLTMVFMVSILLFSMVFNSDFSGANIVKIFVVIVGAVWANCVSYEKFSECFIKIMFTLALFSLIIYPFSGLIIQYSAVLPKITNIGGTQVVTFVFDNICLQNDGIIRNYGIFWEPGVYASYLCLALMMSLHKTKLFTLCNVVLILTIISTISTAGICMLILILFTFVYVKDSESNSVNVKVLFLIFGLVVMAFVLSSENIMLGLTEKLNPSSYKYMSTQARLSSITGNIEIIKKHFLFGAGSSQMDKEYLDYCLRMGLWDKSNTNALLTNFSCYGVFLGIVYLVGMFRFSMLLNCTKTGRICICIVLSMMLFAEPFVTSLMFNLLPFYGYGIEKQQIEVGYRC